MRKPVTGRKQKTTFLLIIEIFRAGVAFGPNYLASTNLVFTQPLPEWGGEQKE